METDVPTAGNSVQANMSAPPSEEPVAWWVKLLVLVVVAAMCLAFAGLIWALAL